MNVNEQDFQNKLDEIGKHYEDGKDAIYSMISATNRYETDKALEAIRGLRDIAAMAVKSAYQLKEN
jgi:hypothetical protein